MRTPLFLTACITGGALLMGGIFVAATPTEFWTSDRDTTSSRSTTPTTTAAVEVDPATNVDMESIKDRAYIRTLDKGGIAYTSETEAIEFGRVTCLALDSGVSWDTALDVLIIEGGFAPGDAGFALGAATAAFCPHHA